jgi:hypothetical protein
MGSPLFKNSNKDLKVINNADGTASLVPGGPGSLPTAVFLDTSAVLNAAVSAIPSSTASALTVIASLSQAVNSVKIADTTGLWIDVYNTPSGAASALAFVICPGDNSYQAVNFAASSSVSIRQHFNAAAATAGELCLQFS